MSIVKVEMRGEGSYLDKRNGAVQSAAAIHEAEEGVSAAAIVGQTHNSQGHSVLSPRQM